ncbi:MAG TPA: c-type cytochrome, partial [Verrucomicrobiae bacterium]
GGERSQIYVLDTASGEILYNLEAGHTTMSPVLSRDEQTLFVCNRFNDDLGLYDLGARKELCRIPVRREPVSAALTLDGRHLLVASHLPRGRSDVAYVAATVSVVDVAARKVVKDLRLPNGSINLRQISVSPDGRYGCVPLSVGRFQVPVTQLDRGWANTSAMTLIDLSTLEILNTVLLDDVDHGAANPWATGWSADSHSLFVTHAGTHELSVIDFGLLLEKISSLPRTAPTNLAGLKDAASRCQADVVNDLSFVHGLRRRVKLNGNGPRALATAGAKLVVAGYFSDSLDVVDLSRLAQAPEAIPLNPGLQLTTLRRGEMYFNDASICFQGWQSCASCHDDDGRVDGLNWDLLNDGIGNPKDTKSLVLSHKTPPVMSLGVRATAEIAVRSGIQNSLGTMLPEEVASSIDAWLRSLQPARSPCLVQGKLSEQARRGEQIFKSPATGCAGCHESELFTDLQSYNVGTRNEFDREDRVFDTPTLRELWRTAPYLHDGSAATLRDVLTTRNPKDEHGKTSHLSPAELDDLVEYLRSL